MTAYLPVGETEEEAFIALGSNLGDREDYLKKAILALHEHPGIDVRRISAVYETSPVGFREQGHFLNMAVAVSTRLAPEPLLDVLLQVEQQLGRRRTVRWGPRTIDLDLLLYGDRRIRTSRLTVPHPRMHERLFVLVPLSEVLGDAQFPGFPSISRLIQSLDGKEEIRLWKKIVWRCESGRFEN